uniref:Uncharacterized protein n=1 Tax=Glossina palpalis gambiensis TaxID=67801 RepID=A0A1B0BBQ4_9MUSC
MLYLVQRGKVRSQVINVPEGLPEVLSDIAREVLRCQPTTECLCQFIIDYMHSVIMAREKALVAKSIIDRALTAVDEVIADMCICDISKEKSEVMCAALEECFQRFLAKRRCEQGRRESILKFNEIDLLDELIMKCEFSESELKVSRPIIEAAYEKFVGIYMTAQQNAESTDALYQYFRERERKRADERRRQIAAVKIQAWYRGSHLRKSLYNNGLLVIEEPHEESSESDEMILVKEMAARKIQQFFRNRLSSMRRKDSSLKNLEELCEFKSKDSISIHPSRYDFQIGEEDEDQIVDKTVPEKDLPTENTPERAEVPKLMESMVGTKDSAKAEFRPINQPSVVKPESPKATTQIWKWGYVDEYFALWLGYRKDCFCPVQSSFLGLDKIMDMTYFCGDTTISTSVYKSTSGKGLWPYEKCINVLNIFESHNQVKPQFLRQGNPQLVPRMTRYLKQFQSSAPIINCSIIDLFKREAFSIEPNIAMLYVLIDEDHHFEQQRSRHDDDEAGKTT